MPRKKTHPGPGTTTFNTRALLEASSAPLLEFEVPESLMTAVREFADGGGSPVEFSSTHRDSLRRIRCTWLNRGAAEMLGTDGPESTQELLDDWVSARGASGPIGLTDSMASALSGRNAGNDFKLVREDGVTLDIRVTWCHYRAFDDTPRLMATLVDITRDTETLRSLDADRADLERALAAQVRQVQQFESTLLATSELVGELVATRDPYTTQHMHDVAQLVSALTARLRYDQASAAKMHRAALLHDVGKIAVPAELLNRSTQLSQLELLLIQDHVNVGRELLTSAGFDDEIVEMVHQHHERWDGSGYPQGLAGEAISPGSRVLAVADVVVSMRTHRPYRAALPIAEVLAELETGAGVRYDPDVARVAIEELSTAVTG